MLLPFLAYFPSGYLVSHPYNVSCSCSQRPVRIVIDAYSRRHLFTLKAIVAPAAGITFFIWCIVRAKGVGPIIRQPSTLHGSDLSWAMIVSLMSCISNMATLVTYAASLEHVLPSRGGLLTLSWCRSNAPDFASRAKHPFAAGLPQLLAVPLTFSIVSFIGIIVSSSSQVIFGEPVWSPVDLLDRFLDDNPSHATRFGVCSCDPIRSSFPRLTRVPTGVVHFDRVYHSTGM